MSSLSHKKVKDSSPVAASGVRADSWLKEYKFSVLTKRNPMICFLTARLRKGCSCENLKHHLLICLILYLNRDLPCLESFPFPWYCWINPSVASWGEINFRFYMGMNLPHRWTSHIVEPPSSLNLSHQWRPRINWAGESPRRPNTFSLHSMSSYWLTHMEFSPFCKCKMYICSIPQSKSIDTDIHVEHWLIFCQKKHWRNF